MKKILLLLFATLFMTIGVFAGDGNGSAIFGSKTNDSVFENYGQMNLNADAKEVMNFGKSDKEQGFMLHTQSGAIQSEKTFNSKTFVNVAVKSKKMGTPNSLYFGAYHKSAGLTENAGDVNETYGYMNHKKTENIKKIVDTFADNNFIKKKMLASSASAFVKTHNVPNLEKTTHNLGLIAVNSKDPNLKNVLTGSAVFAYVNGAYEERDGKNINLRGLNVNTGSNISFAKSTFSTFINKFNIENEKTNKYAGATNVTDLEDTTTAANTAATMNNNTEKTKTKKATTSANSLFNSDTIDATTIVAFQDGDKTSIGIS